MKNKMVHSPSIRLPIQLSPGFLKKLLSERKLDLMALCSFGCLYCSSNFGNFLRINKKLFGRLAEEQIGKVIHPGQDPSLTILWPDVIQRLEEQLLRKPKSWGAGETLIVSMLTDAFSPPLLLNGTTERALKMVLDRSSFRIRILTKCSIVSTPKWADIFNSHRDRFVVGLSIGTTDDAWSRRIEIGTSTPSARLDAHTRLQHAEVPTYGMLCPVFPDMLKDKRLEDLVDRIRPDRVEHIWAEPYNDRKNWGVVRNGFATGSAEYNWFTNVYEQRDKSRWSGYATELYVRLRDKARREGWIGKLRYLLYERDITECDAREFSGLEGVLLQSATDESGMSKNPWFAPILKKTERTSIVTPI